MTSASVVEDGIKILSNAVSGQESIHKRYGGIIMNSHPQAYRMIWPVVDEALGKADISLDDLSAIPSMSRPGLIGSLLVGCSLQSIYSRDILSLP